MAAWPVVTDEPRDWAPDEDTLARMDVWQRMRAGRPYRAAVVPPIATCTPEVSAATTDLVAEATADVSRFDTQAAALPVPMPAVLLRTESASSSQIENLTASARQIAMAALGVTGRHNAEIIAANTTAMQVALTTDGPVDADLLLQVHRTLLAGSQPDDAGRWRDEQVWIGTSGTIPHTASYVAPHHEQVPKAVADLVSFAARADVPPLVLAALVHAQFETIHPFTDGNGRTGRVLLHAVLREHGLVRHATVPVSAGLLADTRGYVDALTTYRDGDLDPIVSQVATAALAATDNGRTLAAQVLDIRHTWGEAIRARTDSAVWRLADELFAQPVVDAAWVAAHLGVSDRTARTTLDMLTDAGVVTETTGARRNRVWQASAVLAAMDAFAARAEHRR